MKNSESVHLYQIYVVVVVVVVVVLNDIYMQFNNCSFGSKELMNSLADGWKMKSYFPNILYCVYDYTKL